MAQIRESEEKDPRTYAIIGAAMEVHSALGPGFLESVYHEALGIELAAQKIPGEPQAQLRIRYKGKELNATYKVDFLCFGEILVEIKAIDRLGGIEQSQIVNYLKAGGYKIGLLLNFGSRSLEYRRFIYTDSTVRVSKLAPIIKT